MPIGDAGVPGLSSNFNEVPSGKANSLRRSQRVCLNVDIEVRVDRAGENVGPELTKTLIVNAHGALILLKHRVAVGDLLRIKNHKTQEELACRVVDCSAGTTGVPEVGIEFVKPSLNFWHIAFPPADWNPRGPESKLYGPQAVTNLARGQKR
jgi:PilZ domain